MTTCIYVKIGNRNIVVNSQIFNDTQDISEVRTIMDIHDDATIIRKLTENEILCSLGQIGDSWVPTIQSFREPKPFSSWILSEDEKKWVSPIGPSPEPVYDYSWDEDIRQWVFIEELSAAEFAEHERSGELMASDVEIADMLK